MVYFNKKEYEKTVKFLGSVTYSRELEISNAIYMKRQKNFTQLNITFLLLPPVKF